MMSQKEDRLEKRKLASMFHDILVPFAERRIIKMKNKFKKITSVILITILLCNVFGENVSAETMFCEDGTTVYVDGVEFKVALNDDLGIEVEGHSDVSGALLVIDQDGNAELEIENDEDVAESEQFELEIEDLSQDQVDIDVYEDGDYVDDISSIEDIIEDNYTGQAAIALGGGVVISLGMVLEALLAAMLAVVIAGVVYIVVTKFCAKVEEATATKKKKAKKYYYKAAVWNGQVVVVPKAISKSKAIKRVKQNLSVYSFTSSMARDVIIQSGAFSSTSEIDAKRYKGHVYLWHYHKASANGHALHTGAFHSFYGVPVLGTL